MQRENIQELLYKLGRALEREDQQQALSLIAKGGRAFAQARDKHHDSALMMAVFSGNEACATALLADSDAGERNTRGESALYLAARGASVPCVEMVATACPQSARGVDYNGNTPLMAAARQGEGLIVRALIPFSDASARQSDTGRDALMLAAAAGCAQSVEELAPVSDPMRVDHQGQSALMIAALQNNGACVERLMPLSDPWSVDIEGKSVFDLAREKGAWDIIALMERCLIQDELMASKSAPKHKGL